MTNWGPSSDKTFDKMKSQDENSKPGKEIGDQTNFLT
jgi:hypothetical protein